MTTKLQRVLAKRRWQAGDAEFVLEAQAGSGLSLTEFGREHGVLDQRLQRWQLRLRRRGAETSEAPSPLQAAMSSPVSLVPVRLRGRLEEAAPVAWGAPRTLAVAVGAGVIQVPAEFDIDHLRRVIEALAPC